MTINGIIMGHGIIVEDELVMIPQNIKLRTFDRLGKNLLASSVLLHYFSTPVLRENMINNNISEIEQLYNYTPHTYNHTDLIYNIDINMNSIFNMHKEVEEIQLINILNGITLEQITTNIIPQYCTLLELDDIPPNKIAEFDKLKLKVKEILNNYCLSFQVCGIITNQTMPIHKKLTIIQENIICNDNTFGYITYPLPVKYINNKKNNKIKNKIYNKIKNFCAQIIGKEQPNIIDINEHWDKPLKLDIILDKIKTNIPDIDQNYILFTCRGVSSFDIIKIDCDINSLNHKFSFNTTSYEKINPDIHDLLSEVIANDMKKRENYISKDKDDAKVLLLDNIFTEYDLAISTFKRQESLDTRLQSFELIEECKKNVDDILQNNKYSQDYDFFMEIYKNFNDTIIKKITLKNFCYITKLNKRLEFIKNFKDNGEHIIFIQNWILHVKDMFTQILSNSALVNKCQYIYKFTTDSSILCFSNDIVNFRKIIKEFNDIENIDNKISKICIILTELTYKYSIDNINRKYECIIEYNKLYDNHLEHFNKKYIAKKNIDSSYTVFNFIDNIKQKIIFFSIKHNITYNSIENGIKKIIKQNIEKQYSKIVNYFENLFDDDKLLYEKSIFLSYYDSLKTCNNNLKWKIKYYLTDLMQYKNKEILYKCKYYLDMIIKHSFTHKSLTTHKQMLIDYFDLENLNNVDINYIFSNDDLLKNVKEFIKYILNIPVPNMVLLQRSPFLEPLPPLPPLNDPLQPLPPLQPLQPLPPLQPLQPLNNPSQSPLSPLLSKLSFATKNRNKYMKIYNYNKNKYIKLKR